MTIEQLEQKAEKKRDASDYVVVEDFSGQACDPNFGWSVMLSCFYCSDESTLAVTTGERVKVTRVDGKWVYGWRETEVGDPEKQQEPPRRIKSAKKKQLPGKVEECEDSLPGKRALLEKGWFPVDAVKKIVHKKRE